MENSNDPLVFIEWRDSARRNDDEMLHAYRALKIADKIRFTITTEPDPVERLQKIEGIMESWL